MNVLVISDFNADLAARYLSADPTAPVCACTSAPYGQVQQTLRAPAHAGGDGVAFIWTSPDGIIPEYRALLDGVPVRPDDLVARVREFADAIRRFAAGHRLVLVATWVRSQKGRGLGMLDWSAGGEAAGLARMNLALIDALGGCSNVFVLDAQRWLDDAPSGRDARCWFATKLPFTDRVCRAAARDVKAAIRGATGLARKLLVVDLDETLWGGTIGDEGWQNLRLGGHDPVGEAYVDFQRALKALARRGVALAIVSKNDEGTVLAALDRHPEMVLRRSDLAGWRINWNDKAQNVLEIAHELNLGLSGVVFIDDNPAERGRVREALPEVLVPEWPQDPLRFSEALRELDCFDAPAITAEDRARTVSYQQQRLRSESVRLGSSMEEWLETAGIRVRVEPVGPENLTRVVQLANKTNQMNLRTRRFTEPELKAWITERPDRGALAVRVSDRFGDLGLTGLVSWQIEDERTEIVDFVLSCRAMGRQVEQLMAHLVIEAARAANRSTVLARLRPTDRNAPCLTFWRHSGFVEANPYVFTWDVARVYPAPSFLRVERAA